MFLRFVFFFLLFQNGFTLNLPDGSPSLYEPEKDNIVLLNADNYKSKIFGSDKAWFVEFYSHWCGACQRFASHWKELALKTKPWHSRVINIAAINCADQKNDNLCREFNVEYYPTLRLFPPNADFHNSEHDSKLISNRDNLETKIIEFLDQIKSAPAGWPIFKDYTSKRLDTLFIENKNAKHGFLVFESENSVLGKQLILDFGDRTNMVIRRTTVESNSFLVDQFNIDRQKLPVIFLIYNTKGPKKRYIQFSEEFVGKKLDSGIDKRIMFKSLIEEFTKIKKGDLDTNEELLKNENLVLDTNDDSKQNKVFMQDLESSLNMILRYEVPRTKLITGDRIDALKKWLKTLVKYFPGRKEVKNYLANLDRKLSSIKTNEITSDQWIQMTKDDQNNYSYLPESTEWVHCKGSTPNFRGFPCSLWTLFHTLTVRQYELEITKLQPFGKDFDVKEIFESILEFIKYFFRCSECSKNFQKGTLDYLEHLKQPRDPVLYLWKCHNIANKHLADDITADPIYPKIQFPSRVQCEKCYNGSNEFVIDEVFNFLITFYASEKIDPRVDQIKDVEFNGVKITDLKQQKFIAENQMYQKNESSMIIPLFFFLSFVTFGSCYLYSSHKKNNFKLQKHIV